MALLAVFETLLLLATQRALGFRAQAPRRLSSALRAFKEPENPDARLAEMPRRPKSTVRPTDPSLYMQPVPLVPDSEGCWEPLVSEIWADVEKMNKLAEANFKADLARFREYCDHYRTARGVIEKDGRTISAQTRLFEVDQEGRTPLIDAKEFKWAKKLAKRVTPILLEELGTAIHAKSHRNGTWNTRNKLVWSRDQILGKRDEPWDAPVQASEDDDEDKGDPKAGMDEAAKDAAAAAEEMTGGAAPVAEKEAVAEPVAEPEPEEDLEPAWQQLVLQQVSPLKTGVLRFPRAMKAFAKYEATNPPPRNVILGRLPPGCSTEPRSDLQDYLLTVQIPLSGCEAAGLIVAGEKVPYEEAKPIVFDSTYPYSMYNDGDEDLLVAHVDFWHPEVTVDEKQMLAYFWMLWQFDQYHPSTRAKYSRRVNFRKEQERKEKEDRRRAMKKSDKKDGGQGGGGSIARK